jgi:hypothetical protein
MSERKLVMVDKEKLREKRDDYRASMARGPNVAAAMRAQTIMINAVLDELLSDDG